MRLFALTALVLAPVATFAQTTQQASLSKPVAFVSTESTTAATPAAGIAATPHLHDVIVRTAMTSEAMDQAAAEGGVLAYTVFTDGNTKPSFVAPKLLTVVGRKLPLEQATATGADVTLAFIVDNHGVPAEVKVVRSAGVAAIDQGTVEAVRQYRFQPATMNNLPVYAHLTMEIRLQK